MDIGIILYYNNLVEKLKRKLQQESKLPDPRKLSHENPYIKRFRNYEFNRNNRSKIDMSQFIH